MVTDKTLCEVPAGSGLTQSLHPVYRYATILIAAAFLYGLLSGIRWPSRWAVTQMLFDWNFGFAKRGLLGSLLNLVQNNYNYLTLSVIAISFTLIFSALIAAATNNMRKNIKELNLFVILFFTSTGFIYIVHLSGYLDIISLIIIFSATLFPVTPYGLMFRLSFSAIAILCHEASFISFFPFLLFDTWMASNQIYNSKRSYVNCFILLIPAAILAFHIGDSKLDQSSKNLVDYYQQKAEDFNIRDDAVLILSRNISDNASLSSRTNLDFALLFKIIITMLCIFPLNLFYIYVSKKLLLKTHLVDKDMLFSYIAGLSPALLNFLAYDFFRFFALTQVSGFCVLLTAFRYRKDSIITPHNHHTFLFMVALLVCLNLGSSFPLHNEYAMKKFPFSEHIAHILLSWATPGYQFLQIPSR